MMKRFLIFLLCLIAVEQIHAASSVPLLNAFLQSNLNGNGQGITNSFVSFTNMTTAARVAFTPSNGTIVYDSTLNQLYQFAAGAWSAIGSGGGGGSTNVTSLFSQNLVETSLGLFTGQVQATNTNNFMFAQLFETTNAGNSVVIRSNGTVTASGLITGGSFSGNATNLTNAPGTQIDVKSFPFLAKGDGVTDDTAAVNFASLAATALGKKTYFPTGIYALQDTLITDNTSWEGGPGAILTNLTQSLVFITLNFTSTNISFQHFELVGSHDTTIPASKLNTTGLKVWNTRETNIVVNDVIIHGFGTGLQCFGFGGSSIDAGLAKISGINVQYCWNGVYIQPGSEYEYYPSFTINACAFGLVENGANNVFSGWTILSCGTGIALGNEGSGNVGHDAFTGMLVNHALTNALTATNINLGDSFSSCYFLPPKAFITNCIGFSFIGNGMGLDSGGPYAWTFDHCTNFQFALNFNPYGAFGVSATVTQTACSNVIIQTSAIDTSSLSEDVNSNIVVGTSGLPGTNLTVVGNVTATHFNGIGDGLTAVPATSLTGNLSVSRFNGGTGASSSTYWRGDNSWGTPSGGGTGASTADTFITAGNPADLTASQALTGTANEIITTLTGSAPTQTLTLSTPQAIGTSSSPSFAAVTTTGAGFTGNGGGLTNLQQSFPLSINSGTFMSISASSVYVGAPGFVGSGITFGVNSNLFKKLFVVSHSGYLTNLYVAWINSSGVNATGTNNIIVVQKNATDTAFTLNVPLQSTGTYFAVSNVTQSVSYAPNDYICFLIVSTNLSLLGNQLFDVKADFVNTP